VLAGLSVAGAGLRLRVPACGSAAVREDPFLGPPYLGVVARNHVQQDFRTSWIVVLPTLIEGLGLCSKHVGLPVITSQCAP